MSTPTKEQQLAALDRVANTLRLQASGLAVARKNELAMKEMFDDAEVLQHIRDQIASAEPVAWLSEKDGKYLALSSEPPAREDDAWRRDHGISVTPLYALPEPRAASKIPPFDKQWCERMARLEAGHCIQVGGAQPAPAAVPDKRLVSPKFPQNLTEYYEDGFADGWNACRAEVLKLTAAPEPPK